MFLPEKSSSSCDDDGSAFIYFLLFVFILQLLFQSCLYTFFDLGLKSIFLWQAFEMSQIIWRNRSGDVVEADEIVDE